MRVGVVVYQHRGCWCAGTYCPVGTVCSHQEGCVQPGDGSTQTVPDDTHNHDTENPTVSGNPAGAALGDSPSSDPEKSSWETYGPISVLLNAIVFSCLGGGLLARKVFSGKETPTMGQSASHQVEGAVQVEMVMPNTDDDLQPHWADSTNFVETR